MGEFPAFCQSNLPLIYGLYGLAFFVTGVAVALESGRNSQLALARALPFLAAFGLAHGLNQWIEMFMLMMSPEPSVPDARGIEAIVLFLLASSFVFLIEFALRLLRLLEPEHYRRWSRLTWVLVGIYVVGLALDRLLAPWGDISAFWRLANVLARYLLGMTGALLACWAMYVQRRAFLRNGYAQFSRDLIGAALAFAWYALLQLVAPPAPFFPANVINTTTFLAFTAIPVQLFLAAVVAILTFFLLRVLRVFEIEYARRIEQLNRARFEAQENAARELTVLFETCRILSTSLDLNVLLHEAIQRIVTLVEPVVAGAVFLYNEHDHALVVRANYHRPAASLLPDHDERARTLAQRAFETREIAYKAANTEQAILALPLLSGEAAIGAIALTYAGPFSNLAVLQTLSRQLVIAIENAQLYERVQQKEELRGELLERIVAAQEKERKRLARDLHDQTGQTLTALLLGLRSLETVIQNNPPLAQQRLRELEQVCAAALDDLRQLTADLRPAQLDDLGLVAALREMAKTVGERSRIAIEVNVTGPRRRLQPELETILYRVAQEALTNAVRHSQAARIKIELQLAEQSAELLIADDGVGFVPEQVLSAQAPRRAWGLLGMQERVALAGGSFEIESAPGRGTRVKVRVPCANERADAAAPSPRRSDAVANAPTLNRVLSDAAVTS